MTKGGWPIRYQGSDEHIDVCGGVHVISTVHGCYVHACSIVILVNIV